VAGEYLKALELIRASSAALPLQRKPVSIPDTVDPNTKLRLDVAARIAFPDGSVKASTLRRQAAAGHLTIYRIAGKDFTTLANIEEMTTSCRVPAKAPDYGSGQPAETAPKSMSSSMQERRQALAAARATLQAPSVASKPISKPSTIRGPGAAVIRMPSK
jgi:hypothetical protein